MIVITIDQLRDIACGKGVQRFTELFPRGIRVRKWTPRLTMWGLRQFGPDYTWAVARGLIPPIGADLCGADLRRADLCGADLRRADLSGADLREADRGGSTGGATCA